MTVQDLKTKLGKFVEAFFPTPPPKRTRRPKTLHELLEEGHREFYCTRKTYRILTALMPHKDAIGVKLSGCFGANEILFTFNEHLVDGWLIPAGTNCLMYEVAEDV